MSRIDAGQRSIASSLPQLGAQPSQTSRVDRAQLAESSLEKLASIPLTEIHGHKRYFAKVTDHIEALRGGNLKSLRESGLLDGLQAGRKGAAERMLEVEAATAPSPQDNPVATQVRRGYRELNARIDEATRSTSGMTGRGLGMPDPEEANSTAEVHVNADTGVRTVTTRYPDGSQRIVETDPRRPEYSRVVSSDEQGQEELVRDGNSLSRTVTPKDGQATREEYHIDSEGRVVRSRSQAGSDHSERTTANLDGSSDTQRQVGRDAAGFPVVLDEHMDGIPLPQPARLPLPFGGVPGIPMIPSIPSTPDPNWNGNLDSL